LIGTADVIVEQPNMTIVFNLTPAVIPGEGEVGEAVYIKKISSVDNFVPDKESVVLKSDEQGRPVKISLTMDYQDNFWVIYDRSDQNNILVSLDIDFAQAQPVTVDNSPLAVKITEAEAIAANGYTTESYAALQAAIAAARAVISDTFYATQAEIGEQVAALTAAIDGLVEDSTPTVNKTELAAKISQATAIAADGYTAASYATLRAAITAAQTVLGDAGATQGEVNARLTALTSAIDGLVPYTPPSGNNTAPLTAKVTEAAAIPQGNKSAVAHNALKAAVAAAQAVLNDTGATQAEIDAALTALQAAVAAFNNSADVGGGRQQTPGGTVITSLSTLKITAADKVWTGKKIAAGFTLTAGGKKLAAGTDYTVASTGANKNIGPGTVRISGKGAYSGTATVKFKIVPKAVKLKSAKAGKKSLTAKWGKAPKAEKITKYQVRYKVKGVKAWKVKTVSAKKLTLKVGKLKKGKRYNVQVRAYKTVKGVKYYSAWSKIKLSKKVR
jgi:hypothetical protein